MAYWALALGIGDSTMDVSASNSSNGGGSGRRKRPATDHPHDNNGSSDDPVIGLNVGGQKFYTHQSTLTNGSAYFAARFSGNFDTTDSITDEDGREVYFIDASPELFEHILGFLRRGIPSWHENLYKQDSVLYSRLVNEAEYFGVESMLESLRRRTHFVCAPDGSGKDILHWLGTDGGRSEYNNPLDIGAVTFGGSCLTKADEIVADPDGWETPEEQIGCFNSRKEFIQHRPLCGETALFNKPVSDISSERQNYDDKLWFEKQCLLLDCDHSMFEHYLDITFENITIMPTHYSLRYSECYGMSCWDFQASLDGVLWITLHKARKDKSIEQPSNEKLAELLSVFKSKCLHVSDANTKQSIATSIAEEQLRGTWKVEAFNNFYKHFRIKGAGEDCENSSQGCMHGVGFEIYGEVKKE